MFLRVTPDREALRAVRVVMGAEVSGLRLYSAHSGLRKLTEGYVLDSTKARWLVIIAPHKRPEVCVV